jgi:hypothetical protein
MACAAVTQRSVPWGLLVFKSSTGHVWLRCPCGNVVPPLCQGRLGVLIGNVMLWCACMHVWQYERGFYDGLQDNWAARVADVFLHTSQKEA